MSRRTHSLLLGALVLVTYAWVHQRNFTFATPVSRLLLLHAIVDDHSLAIDRCADKTPDKALAGGHYYSDKAPGTAALALAPFAITHRLLRQPDSKSGWLATSWVACVVALAVPTALGAVALFGWLGRFVARRIALTVTLALFLSLPWPYVTAMWSHGLVVGLIAVAVWAVNLFGPVPSQGRLWLAGLCLGWALASEYTAGVVIVPLAGWIVVKRPGWWRAAVAGVLPCLLIPAYSWATVGSPFTLPYSYQASFPEMERGLYAIQWPDLETTGRLLVSPTRGLFFWAPFLLLALAMRSPAGTPWLTLGVPFVLLVIIGGRTWDWEAGWCIGPRYLIPAIPLLALPCALAFSRWPAIGWPLAILSVAIMGVAVVGDAHPSKEHWAPLWDLHVPNLRAGKIGYTLGPAWLLPVVIAGGWWLLWRYCEDRRDCPAGSQ